MKFNKWTLGLAAIAAIGAMALVMTQKATTGVAIGKEGTAQATELVVAKTQTEAGQIGLGEIAQLAIVKEYPALVDTERVAIMNHAAVSTQKNASSIASTMDASANAPNTATSADQVALNAAKITDQLALKCLAATTQFAFTATTGALDSGSA